MLIKLLNVRKLTPFSRNVPPHKPASAAQPEERAPLALKLVHAGGTVECYYMAIPAAKIMEKYPSFIIARPEVFRRPWDSVVRPDQILNPGEKFFVVPRRTVRKLRQRIQKPNSRDISVRSFVSQSSMDVSAEMVSRHKDDVPSQMFNRLSEISSSSEASGSFSIDRKKSARHKHVRISGIPPKQAEKKTNADADNPRKSSNPQAHGRQRKVKNAVAWQPTLTAISESSWTDE